MGNELITLAIHTRDKANILKQVLESRGIQVFLEENLSSSGFGISIKINEKDLTRALTIIEEHNLFSYSDQQTYKIDDGRLRILVAVDFSTYSMNACRVAFHIAKEMNAKVKILHVMQNLYFPSSLPFADTLKEPTDESILDKARKQILDLCLEIDQQITAGEWPSVNYSYSLREGIVEEEIDNFIKEYKPVIVVLGTKGKDKNDTNILGSVTADIIEMTNVPILAVPENAPIKDVKDLKHIAFLTNLSKRDLTSFSVLVSFLKPKDHNAKITLLHVNMKNDKWRESDLLEMKGYLDREYPGLDVKFKLIDAQDKLKGINDFLVEDSVHIVVVNTRRRNIFARMFIPSVSRKMLSKLNIALLVLRG